MERTTRAGTLFGVVQKDVLKRKKSISDENLLYLNQNDSKDLQVEERIPLAEMIAHEQGTETLSYMNANEVPLGDMKITSKNKEDVVGVTGERLSHSNVKISDDPVSLDDAERVLNAYSQLTELLNRGCWAEFKNLIDDSSFMNIITSSPHSDVLIQGISLRLQYYRTQTLQQQNDMNDDLYEQMNLGMEYNGSPVRTFSETEPFKSPIVSRVDNETVVFAESNSLTHDNSNDGIDPCVSIVAEAVANELHKLKAKALGAQTTFSPFKDTANQESESIRKKPLSNARTKAGKKCRFDSRNRIVTRPAVKRDTFNGQRVRVKWSEDEVEALIAGLSKHRGLKWGAILKDPEFGAALGLRTSSDLKDKYLVLRRTGAYNFTELDRAMQEDS